MMSPEHAPEHACEEASAGAAKVRLLSLDAYRGLIMLMLASSAFGIKGMAKAHLKADPDSHAGFWNAAIQQLSHAEWVGCNVWDMIQPSFMFMVGVAMAYSYAKRRAMGHTFGQMFGHAVSRSLILIAIGFVLISVRKETIYWSLMNVLAQIGLGYAFLFLLSCLRFRIQAVLAVVILVGMWMAYESYPAAGIDLTSAETQNDVTPQWAQEHLAGVRPAWHKNANLGYAIDGVLLEWLPEGQKKSGLKFVIHHGEYVTINFITELVTMLLGLWCGLLVKSSRSAGRKLSILVVGGTAGIVAGLLLHWLGVCPIVKKLWTPSFMLLSGGICCLVLALFYAVIDVVRFRFWAFPLAWVGMNPLVVYCTYQLGFGIIIIKTIRTFGGNVPFKLLGEHNGSLCWGICVAVGYCVICLWMVRQKIFVRI